MEWVETIGKSIAEAKEKALDQLGVHEEDADFEVLEEPKQGLFGRVRTLNAALSTCTCFLLPQQLMAGDSVI